MIAELGLHRAVDFADGFVEYHLIEFLHHLAGSETAQVTATFSGGALGVRRRQLGKVGAAFDFGLQVLTLLFGIHENVPCAGLGHDRSPENRIAV